MILDIGSGHKPYKQADILLENYSSGNEHRWGQDIVTDRPTILYNGDFFPFKDKAFDFSTSFHVLEHVDHPDKFLEEIERISKAGYIETPSEIAELVFTPYDKHKWIIYNDSGKLIIKKKLIENTSKLGKLFDYLCDNEHGFNDYFYFKRKSLFFVEYYWKNKINYQIVDASEENFNNLYDDKTLKKLSTRNRISNSIKTHFKYHAKTLSEVLLFLEKNIITPCCKTGVLHKQNDFICKSCSREYSIQGKKIFLIP
ncbi:MAG: methyltransferase domain-containing protein [Bacteroidetes bacterium]|nr:methyltransferase domain-containing protein [Bacteroidota bacterium]